MTYSTFGGSHSSPAPGASHFFAAQRVYGGVLATLAWFGLVTQIVLELQDAITEHLSVSAHLLDYFSFFSTQTNLLVALIGTLTLMSRRPTPWLLRPIILSALVVYIVVVGVAFELLLREKSDGLRFVADGTLHDIVPILYVAYWLIFVPKGRLSWSDPVFWLIYPLFYMAYTFVRGAVFGVYPYPFVNVANLGYREALFNAAMFFVVFLALGVVLTTLDRVMGKSRSRNADYLPRPQ